jgi:hypothetical protein
MTVGLAVLHCIAEDGVFGALRYPGAFAMVHVWDAAWKFVLL